MWASLQQDDPFSVLLSTHIHTLSLSHEGSGSHHPKGNEVLFPLSIY